MVAEVTRNEGTAESSCWGLSKAEVLWTSSVPSDLRLDREMFGLMRAGVFGQQPRSSAVYSILLFLVPC